MKPETRERFLAFVSKIPPGPKGTQLTAGPIDERTDEEMPITKPPWKVTRGGYAVESVHPREGMWPVGDPHPHVASVRKLGDARLIAAAPDLYECADLVLEVFDDLESLSETQRAALRGLCAALTKADQGSLV